MANVGKMNIQAGFDGKPAERGFSALGKSLGNLTSQLKGMSAGLMGKNFFTELSSGIGLLQGLANKVIDFVDAGAKLETTQIQFGYLVGNFQQGAQVLENLRDTAASTGAPLESAVKGFKSLSMAGLSAATSLDLVRQSMQAGELLGGGAQGVDLLANAMVGLSAQSMATEQQLGQIQQGGLRVFEALAQGLSQLTGRAFSVRDAIEELRRGTILSTTAIQALQTATNAPEALEARERFEASFEGQLNRLKGTAQAFMTDISKMILTNLPLNEIFAGLRGLLTGMRDIVSVIISDVGKVFDPAGRLGNIKTAFEAGKKLAIDIAETITFGAINFGKLLLSGAQAVIDAFSGIKGYLSAIKLAWMEFQQTFFFSKSQQGNLIQAQKEFDKSFDIPAIGKKSGLPNLDQTLADMTKFFAKARARSEADQGAQKVPDTVKSLDSRLAIELKSWKDLNLVFMNLTGSLKEAGYVITANEQKVKDLVVSFRDNRISFDAFSNQLKQLNRDQQNEIARAAMNKGNPLLANAAFWNTWEDWTKGLKENGFVISTNNQQVRGLIDSFKAGRIGFNEFEKQMLALNTRTETVKRTIDELSRETLKELATPLETFSRGLEGLTIQSQQLQKAVDAGVVDPADRAKAAQALARKAGKQLQDFLAQNQIGDSFIAGRSEFGTAGAIETVLRNRLGDRGLDIQERIAQGIARQEIIQKEQVKMQDKMIQAIMRVKPGVFILQGK